jgi:two-component system C4-dicarboxylate transport sensor histidine kinase DctB
VALDEAIYNAVGLITLRCKQEQVELIIDCLPGTEVMADLVRLEQVIINLLTNALDAMLDSSEKRLIIRCQSENEQICLQVIDSGTGIDPVHLNQLFDPFFTTKDTGVGLGLGLSISYSIIKTMGGELSASNRADTEPPHSGAIFSVRMPARYQA